MLEARFPEAMQEDPRVLRSNCNRSAEHRRVEWFCTSWREAQIAWVEFTFPIWKLQRRAQPLLHTPDVSLNLA